MLVRRRLYSSFILNYVLGTEQAKYWWAIVTFFNRFLSVSLFLFSYPTKIILILCLTNGYKRLFELRDFPKVLWSLLSRELCSERRLSSPFIFQVTTSFQYMGRGNLTLGAYAWKPYQWSLQNVSCKETCHLLCWFHSFLWWGKTQGLTLSPQWSLFIFPRTK